MWTISKAALAGCVAACVAVALAVGITVVVLVCRRHQRRAAGRKTLRTQLYLQKGLPRKGAGKPEKKAVKTLMC